jgi:Mg2+ and Co2+ transporter CorA
MRIFTLADGGVVESSSLPMLTQTGLPAQGFVWIACARREFEALQAQIQTGLQTLCAMQLVDLHMADLLSRQLPSHYDYTSQYDVLIFRRLAPGKAQALAEQAQPGGPLRQRVARGGPPILRRIDTSPVAFAVFDRVLLTVHPTDCAVRDAYAAKLLGASASQTSNAGAKWPNSPADLMLRIVNQMVDGFLELRRELTHQLDHWQAELINPRTRFNNWGALLDARLTLHQLDEICEDQRCALQDWVEALKTWPDSGTPEGQRERDLLQVRSRDVLEHIERVVHHVRRLEQSIETAVQMHFNAQSHRTNEIMRVLTVLTAIFLPLNLIAGIFGMNFEFIPLLHQSNGFWWALGMMVLMGLGLVGFFWQKNFLKRTPH